MIPAANRRKPRLPAPVGEAGRGNVLVPPRIRPETGAPASWLLSSTSASTPAKLNSSSRMPELFCKNTPAKGLGRRKEQGAAVRHHQHNGQCPPTSSPIRQALWDSDGAADDVCLVGCGCEQRKRPQSQFVLPLEVQGLEPMPRPAFPVLRQWQRTVHEVLLAAAQAKAVPHPNAITCAQIRQCVLPGCHHKLLMEAAAVAAGCAAGAA